MEERTTITIKKATRDALVKAKIHPRETMENVVSRLVHLQSEEKYIREVKEGEEKRT